MGHTRTPSESTTVVPDSEPSRISAQLTLCHDTSPPQSSPCPPPRRTMPTTYGRPRPTLDATASSSAYSSSHPASKYGSNIKDNPPNNTTSRSPSPVFKQDWKKALMDIDNDEYEGEMVQASASSSLTPLVSSSSLSALPGSQPEVLPRSSPPSSPAQTYRDPEHLTDDPDTSIELNTTLTSPSSDLEDQPDIGVADDRDDDSEDEPAVRRRMNKPLRVIDSDEDEDTSLGVKKLASAGGARRLPVMSTSSVISSGNNLSQFSLDQPGVRSSTSTPASSARKPLKLALSDDSDSDRDQTHDIEGGGDQIEDASESPKAVRTRRMKGLNKTEKSEMAKTQQAIVASRTIRVPDASKRIDSRAAFDRYNSSIEIQAYPFPPGSRTHKTDSQKPLDPKTIMRRKIGMLPLSAHAAPKVEPLVKSSIPQSDPIISSPQSQAGPTMVDHRKDEDEEDEGGRVGKLSPLGALIFGAPKAKGRTSADVFGPDPGSSDKPPTPDLSFAHRKKSAQEVGKAGTSLLERKLALLAAQETIRRIQSDSDSDIELDIGSQTNKPKDKGKSRVLVRPGQEPQIVRKPARQEITESQVERAGHAVHFGRDAAQIGSSPVRGGGVYEESQFGRVTISGSAPTRMIRPKPTPRKSVGSVPNVSISQLTRHAANRAQADGQARQKADEERWKATGGKGKVDREGGLKVEDAVRQALLGEAARGDDENENEDDEGDDDYHGSASDSEDEDDKENLPASGRTRQPHEPVSDFDGSGGEETDADKENSLELVGMGSKSPGVLGVRSPIQLNGRSPAQAGALSPGRIGTGLSPALSPANAFGLSPSHLHTRLHSRVSSSGSGRLPLSELEDDEVGAGDGENVAVARAPLGEIDVELEGGADEVEDEDIPRRPTKRAKSSIARRLFDEEDEDVSGSPSVRLLSPSRRRLGSPSQRLLGSPSQRVPASARFRSPPSRLRSPLPAGTQGFSQVETQAMLGGLGDVFAFESQMSAQGDGRPPEDGEGDGLTQLFANAEVGTSSAFAALRSDANTVELTQDERSKLLYRPILRDDELKRDQDLFEREDELMAQPFSPTQREKHTQGWLNERGLWTQTRPAQPHLDSFGSTPQPPTQRDTPSPLVSPTGSATSRRRIVRRGGTQPEDAAEPKLSSVLDRLMSGARDAAAKGKKKKKKLDKSEFVEGEAAESDDEYGDFGPRNRVEDEEDGEEDEDRHVEGLVDDAVMDQRTENATEVQAKYFEQNVEEDALRERVAREVVTGKMRNRRRGRGDNMGLDDDDSEDDGYSGPKKFLKKRKIENDGLDGLEKHESTRPFVEMYNKGIKSADDDDFQHLNQIVDDPLGGDPDPEDDDDANNAEEEGEEEEEESDANEEVREEAVTPFKAPKKYIPSSAGAEIAFGLEDESDEEPVLNLPDAAPRPMASVTHGQPTKNPRLSRWAAQEGNSIRVSLRGGQGASVTGHSKGKVAKGKAGGFARPVAPNASSSNSNRLSRLGSKADGFV